MMYPLQKKLLWVDMICYPLHMILLAEINGGAMNKLNNEIKDTYEIYPVKNYDTTSK